MKAVKVFLFSFFLLVAHSFFSQEITQTVRGVTLDKQTQSPLPGCIVQILGVDNKNAVSDENGKFRIENVPIGRRQIKISLLSYKEKIQTVIVSSGKEIVMNVELEESVIQGEEVVVRAEAD